MSSTSGRNPLNARVRSFCRAHLAREAMVVAAVSGGADSVALLYALRAASAELGFELRAAHVNHRLRAAATHRYEARLVRSTCAELGVPLLLREPLPGTVDREAERARCGPEAAARVVRYRELAAAAAECGARFVATGHQLDDQLETLLLRFLRGSGPAGLAGIPERGPLPMGAGSVEVLRPLLWIDRKLIIEYLQSVGGEYVEDESNRSPSYTRNRVRHELLPLLDELVPGYRASVTAAAARHRQLAQFLRAEACVRCPWELTSVHPGVTYPEAAGPAAVTARLPDGQGLSCDSERFFALPPPLRREVLCIAYDLVVPGGAPLPFRFLERVAKGLPPLRDGVVLQGCGVRVWRRRGRLFCARDVVLTAKKGYVFVVLKDITVPIGAVGTFSITTTEAAWEEGGDNRGLLLDRSSLHEPVLVRSRRPGDTVVTRSGTKKIKNIFSEWGLNEEQRAVVPIVEDREGILVIFGQPFGHPAVLAARVAAPATPEAPPAKPVRITFDGV